MGASQSTNRAAKFSGSKRRVQSCNSAPPSAPTVRRQLSQRNTNRNVKEFSKFWSDGGSFRPKSGGPRRSESVRRVNSVRRTRTMAVEQPPPTVITPLSTPHITPRSPRNSQQLLESQQLPSRSLSQYGAYAVSPARYERFDDDIISEFGISGVQANSTQRLQPLQFPHETAIY
ncbi:hypothetical protein OSTOST_17384 [Ostertagia ostertagi]